MREQGRIESYTPTQQESDGETIRMQITPPTEEKLYTEEGPKPDSNKLQLPIRKRTTKRTNRSEQNKEAEEKQAKQTTQHRKTIGEDGNRHADINDNRPKKTRLNQEKETEQKEREQEKKEKGNHGTKQENPRNDKQEPSTQS